MKKEDLIKQIQEKVPDGMEVAIFDHRKNLSDDIGNGSSSGIYQKFEVVMHSHEEISNGCIGIGALYFDNDDYTDDGENISK